MSMYKQIKQTWQNKENKELIRDRKIEWRKALSFVKITRPTRLDKARALGYKAKEGFIIVRARVKKGGRKRPKITSGRRPRRYGRVKYTTHKSLRWIAEERTARKYPNLEVLNSYWVTEDGQHKWYEVILVDPYNPNITKDQDINWICERQHKNRVYRGLTSAGKKSRGLRKSTKG